MYKRQLSCTPLFSKVLESFILKRLKDETSLSDSQYGGLKGCGVDHFLVKTWDEVLGSLEDERSCVNLISVDFEKAFNRMDRLECLKALRDHGASTRSLRLVGAFLLGRCMRIKIGEALPKTNKRRQPPRQHLRQLSLLCHLRLA